MKKDSTIENYTFTITADNRDLLCEALKNVNLLHRNSDDKMCRVEIDSQHIRFYSYLAIDSKREPSFVSYKQIQFDTTQIFSEVPDCVINMILIDIKTLISLFDQLDNESGVFKCKITHKNGSGDALYVSDDVLKFKHIGGDEKLMSIITVDRIESKLKVKPIADFTISEEHHRKIQSLMKTNSTDEIIKFNIVKGAVRVEDKRWNLTVAQQPNIDDEWVFRRLYLQQHKTGNINVQLHDNYIITNSEDGTLCIFSVEITDY